MTVDEVKKRVSDINDMRGDDEAAHSAEDMLHQDVLAAIADGCCDDPKRCAEEALRTRRIEFARWCA